MLKTVLPLIFALFLGCACTFLILSLGIDFSKTGWEIWALLSFFCASCLGISLFFPAKKKAQKMGKAPEAEIMKLKETVARLEKEFKLVIRGHLKFSILFWAHHYKKEKIKTFEDAKKEVFLELKKEFPHLQWMESLLEDIRQELLKYK